MSLKKYFSISKLFIFPVFSLVQHQLFAVVCVDLQVEWAQLVSTDRSFKTTKQTSDRQRETRRIGHALARLHINMHKHITAMFEEYRCCTVVMMDGSTKDNTGLYSFQCTFSFFMSPYTDNNIQNSLLLYTVWIKFFFQSAPLAQLIVFNGQKISSTDLFICMAC